MTRRTELSWSERRRRATAGFRFSEARQKHEKWDVVVIMLGRTYASSMYTSKRTGWWDSERVSDGDPGGHSVQPGSSEER